MLGAICASALDKRCCTAHTKASTAYQHQLCTGPLAAIRYQENYRTWVKTTLKPTDNIGRLKECQVAGHVTVLIFSFEGMAALLSC